MKGNTHTSLTQEIFILAPNEVLSVKENYLVILATCLFFVVPFVYTWSLARNEQSKKFMNAIYVNSCKIKVRSENLFFKSDDNQQVTQMKAHIMHWFIVKMKCKLFIQCLFFFQLIFDLVIKIGSTWYEFGSKTQNIEK